MIQEQITRNLVFVVMKTAYPEIVAATSDVKEAIQCFFTTPDTSIRIYSGKNVIGSINASDYFRELQAGK